MIETSPSGDRVLYKVSEKGKKEYKEWLRRVLEFGGYPSKYEEKIAALRVEEYQLLAEREKLRLDELARPGA